MKESSHSTIFHLAIPTHDLALAEEFYGITLGCPIARRYEDRVTLNFFGAQVVCHLDPTAFDANPSVYPRHFGLTFADYQEFDRLIEMMRQGSVRFLEDRFTRWAGRPDEHESIIALDPTNNVLEFKYYKDPAMRY